MHLQGTIEYYRALISMFLKIIPYLDEVAWMKIWICGMQISVKVLEVSLPPALTFTAAFHPLVFWGSKGLGWWERVPERFGKRCSTLLNNMFNILST